MRFKDKVALISAAANGIGRATATIMAREGATVIAVDNHQGRLDEAVPALRQAGVVVAIARLSERRAQDQAGRSGLVEAIGADHVFLSVEDAVRKLGPNRSPP